MWSSREKPFQYDLAELGRLRPAFSFCWMEDFSAFHRLHSDEMWHFYEGSGLVVHVIEPSGSYSKICLGRNAEKGQVFQAVVTAGCWFASEVIDQKSYALVGCTVAPGFDFEDFELATRPELSSACPQHRELIERLTRD